MKALPFYLFFNILGMPYPDLFPRKKPVWEVISRLPSYVEDLFSSGKAVQPSLAQRAQYRDDWVYLEERVSIGKGTRIYPFAYIGNDVVVGQNCVIGQGAVLKGPLILCDNCVVGPHGEVGKSFFFPEAKAAHKNFVGESIVGWGVNLGAGAESANWKLDGSEISLWADEEKIETRLTKFGAVIGDGTSVGGQAVLNPGAMLGKYCRVGPNVTVPNQYYPGGTYFKSPKTDIKILTSKFHQPKINN